MYHLKNHVENIVSELADELIPQYDMCQCEKCRLDVMAIALNHLQPVYVVSSKGELFASIDATYPQNKTDAMAAVLTGIRIVKDSPKHARQ